MADAPPNPQPMTPAQAAELQAAYAQRRADHRKGLGLSDRAQSS